MSTLSGVNQLVNLPFTVFDIDGSTLVTGLGDGDFTKVLLLEATVSALAVVISEVGGGDYVASLTPDTIGDWRLRILTPAGVQLGEKIQVSEDDIGEAASLTRKYVTNAQEVDIATQEFVIYDDDGVTALQRHDLDTDGGEDVLTSTGVQVSRGVPKL